MNGEIWYRVGGGDGPSWWSAVNADGSGGRIVFGDGSPVVRGHIAWSPTGDRIVFADLQRDGSGIATSTADGSEMVRLTTGANDDWPSWSPDGDRIVFSSSASDPTVGPCEPGAFVACPTDIYVMNADGTDVIRLTDDPAAEYDPVWSPDGARIAFVGATGGTCCATEIWVMNADGTGLTRVASSSDGSNMSPSWSPDGAQLVFSSIRNEDWGIFVVDVASKAERSIRFQSGEYVDDPVWSPEGDLIAFVAPYPECPGCGSALSLYVMNPDGSDATLVSDEIGYGVAGDIAWQPILETASPSTSLGPTAAPASVVVSVDPIPVADYSNAVVIGAGSAWISAPRGDGSGGGDIVRIDATTGDVLARIPVESVPGWEFGGGGLAFGLGSVWVMGTTFDGDRADRGNVAIARIDPRTDLVADTIDLGPGYEADVWVDPSGIWALTFLPDSTEMEVVHLDPSTFEVIARIAVPATWGQTIFAAGGWVWVSGTAPHADGPVAVNTLYRLDPTSDTLDDTIPVAGDVFRAVFDEISMWEGTKDGNGVQRRDPTTGQLIGEVVATATSTGCCTNPMGADGSGGVWTIFARKEGAQVTHVTAFGLVDRSSEVHVSDVGSWQGVAFAFDSQTQTFWVVQYQDTVTRLQLSPA